MYKLFLRPIGAFLGFACYLRACLLRACFVRYSFRRIWLPGVAALGLSAMSMLASAAESRAIEEVVVTAQRTEEGIQDVPIAVTAMTGEMLEDRGALTPSDLQMNAPSLSFTPTNFGGSSFSECALWFGEPNVAIRISSASGSGELSALLSHSVLLSALHYYF